MELKTIYGMDHAKEIGFKWPDVKKKTEWGDVEKMVMEWESHIREKHEKAKEEARKDLKIYPLLIFCAELGDLDNKIIEKTIFRKGSSDLISRIQRRFIIEMVVEVNQDIKALSPTKFI